NILLILVTKSVRDNNFHHFSIGLCVKQMVGAAWLYPTSAFFWEFFPFVQRNSQFIKTFCLFELAFKNTVGEPTYFPSGIVIPYIHHHTVHAATELLDAA